MESHGHNHDPIHHFLMESYSICTQALFIIDSLLNAELAALYAVHTIFLSLDNLHLNSEDINISVDYINNVLMPLQDFLDNPPPLPSSSLLCILLHDLGNSWEAVTDAQGIVQRLVTAQQAHTAISNNNLDEIVAKISISHPFIDAIGVLLSFCQRWSGIIKHHVYKVHGANALWHNDGNEKLCPWGFWVHGCVDGHSRLIIYLECCSNKCSDTVCTLFLWDYGKENNRMELELILHWGEEHRAYFSTHNDSLKTFRKIFTYLEEQNLLDMENSASLNHTCDTWNHHQLCTEHYKTPIVIYELSWETAIRQGYWTGNPGDNADQVHSNPHYGIDRDIEDDYSYAPPETQEDPADTEVNCEEDINMAREMMGNFDFERDDMNWGIEVYCKAVSILMAILASAADNVDHSGSE
ncbi:hypothetical protein EDD85DRAFT_924154 [Armillaria nabsnona]|nr:hypothetical protein EDD85DRAFT_924154 [Armillaria nabsnona]